MDESLGPRRERILRYLARRAGVGEPPPRVREAAAAAGLRSSQTAHHPLRKLEEGHVVREAGRAKMIRLTEKGGEAAGRMALMGRIAAGSRPWRWTRLTRWRPSFSLPVPGGSATC